jgi:NitT/TauT family transport system ATP-binding protein
MRQRVALIRTLVSNPKILLLDEPFSALDYQTRLSVCDDVYKIIKAERKTAVLVTHDISEALSMSDIIVVLSNRPAKVKTIYQPNLNGDTPLKKRESENFGFWFEKIWKQLN